MEATPVKKTVRKNKAAVPPPPPPAPAPHLKLYRRIAVTFVAVTFLTLAVVIYLSFSRATIHVTPEARAVTTTFVADVVASPAGENDVEGTVVSNVFEQSTEQPVTGGETKAVEGKAGGMVTIYNKTNNAQPLVATTRLLSPTGILFRIDTGVTVPAQGSVQVMAHADQPGAAGDIGPTTFTIPGLNTTLQQSIYAESTAAFLGGLSQVRVISQADLDAAGEILQTEMLAAAKETLRLQSGGTFSGEAFFPEVVEKLTDTPPGTESGTVRVSLKLRVVAVFFDREELFAIAEAKLFEQIPNGMELEGVDENSLEVTVQHYDLEQKIANLNVTLAGTATLSLTSDLLDKEQFLGKSSAEVKRGLESSDAIKSVEITFTPFWLKRMPTLKDHIKVVIE